MIITAADVRAAGYCLHIGARRWCSRHGVDFRRLMREGIPVAELGHINDVMLSRILEIKTHGQ
jgi:hypothetical protein